MKQSIINAILYIEIGILGIFQMYSCLYKNEPHKVIIILNVDKEKSLEFLNKEPKDGLLEALEYYEVKYPEIVYAQAILETGHFKSDLCINDNNLFGLYNSKEKKYYTFNHWSESITAYMDFVQYKYKPPNDYYKFLLDIGYAKDPNYISKLKGIVNRNDKRRSE